MQRSLRQREQPGAVRLTLRAELERVETGQLLLDGVVRQVDARIEFGQ